VKAGNVDGLAYDPITRRLFVSDESGGKDTVIDTATNRVVARIDLGGQAGNTVYDPASGHIFVAVQTRNMIAEIDPAGNRVIRSYPIPGCNYGHGLIVSRGTAYVACQANARLVRLDLVHGNATGAQIGSDPDVLALDERTQRLYVAAESGVVSVFDVSDSRLTKLGEGFYADNAHVVAVDPLSHHLFFPLRNVNGHPVLRIAAPL
jgi:DNA-binding beta-propeller fold protein YncE